MKKFRLSLLILFLLVFSNFTQASEDDLFPSTTIKIENGSHPQTGEVSAIIESNHQNITSFTALAFGKKFKLAKKDLSKLEGFSYLNLHITHSASYKELGGHTVNYKFIPSYAAGHTNQRKEYAIVFVTKEKGISVFKYVDPN